MLTRKERQGLNTGKELDQIQINRAVQSFGERTPVMLWVFHGKEYLLREDALLIVIAVEHTHGDATCVTKINLSGYRIVIIKTADDNFVCTVFILYHFNIRLADKPVALV